MLKNICYVKTGSRNSREKY